MDDDVIVNMIIPANIIFQPIGNGKAGKMVKNEGLTIYRNSSIFTANLVIGNVPKCGICANRFNDVNAIPSTGPFLYIALIAKHLINWIFFDGTVFNTLILPLLDGLNSDGIIFASDKSGIKGSGQVIELQKTLRVPVVR